MVLLSTIDSQQVGLGRHWQVLVGERGGGETTESSRQAIVPAAGKASAHTFSAKLRDTKVGAEGIL